MKTPSLFSFSLLIALACQGETHDRQIPSLRKPLVGDKLTLAAATQEALACNRTIQEARARWESMKERIPQAAAWDDLKVSTSTRLGRFVDVAPNSFTDHMLTVEQMIPLSGKNQCRARIAAAEAVGSWEELRRKQFDVVLKVRTSFLRRTSTRSLLELNRANETSLSQTLANNRAKFEAGKQSQAEVLTAEGELIRIAEARRDLERIITEQESQLKVQMNRDAFSSLGTPAGDTPRAAELSAERLRSLMVNNRPELKMASANTAAAAAKVELAKREWIPDPTISVGAQRYNETSQAVSEVTAGVSFGMPWLNGRKYRAGEREAVLSQEAARRALEAAQTEASGMLRDQIAKIEVLHHHVMLFRDRLLPTVRQTVESNRAGYESDKTGFLELVSSQRSLLESESMYRQHLNDYEVALAELEALVGADLNIFPVGNPDRAPIPSTQRKR